MRRKRFVLLLFFLYLLLFSCYSQREKGALAQGLFNQQDSGLLQHRRQSEEADQQVFDLTGQIQYRHCLSAENEKAKSYHLERLYQEGKDYQQGKENSRQLADWLQIRLWGNERWEKSEFFWKMKGIAQTDGAKLEKKTELEEAYLSWALYPGLQLSAGQKIFPWGKSRSFNPQAFLDLPRHPLDFDPSRCGLIFCGLEYGQKFPPGPDPLKELTLTTLAFPVQERINEEFGQPKHWNLAGKLSLLFWNTEIDFLALRGKSRPERYGFSFSRQLGPIWEIYGDFGVSPQYDKIFLDRSGTLWQTRYAAFYSLWGIQYKRETIRWSAEYYRNKAGFTPQEMQDYYQYLDKIVNLQSSENENQALAKRLLTLTETYYRRPDLMQEYAYFEIMKREPLDLRPLTFSLAGVWNLQDRSYGLCPQLQYRAKSNLSLSLRAPVAAGEPNSEFGEKSTRWAAEVWLNCSFELFVSCRPYPESRSPDSTNGSRPSLGNYPSPPDSSREQRLPQKESDQYQPPAASQSLAEPNQEMTGSEQDQGEQPSLVDPYPADAPSANTPPVDESEQEPSFSHPLILDENSPGSLR